MAEALSHVQQDGADRDWGLKILSKMGDIDVSRLDWRQGLEVFQRVREIDPDDEEASAKIIDLNLRLAKSSRQPRSWITTWKCSFIRNVAVRRWSFWKGLRASIPESNPSLRGWPKPTEAPGAPPMPSPSTMPWAKFNWTAETFRRAIHTIRTIIEMGPPDLEGYEELIRNLESQK